MPTLRDRAGIAPRALEFVILTGMRTEAVIKARWSEIDIAEKVWTVPPERAKEESELEGPPSRALVCGVEAAGHDGERQGRGRVRSPAIGQGGRFRTVRCWSWSRRWDGWMRRSAESRRMAFGPPSGLGQRSRQVSRMNSSKRRSAKLWAPRWTRPTSAAICLRSGSG